MLDNTAVSVRFLIRSGVMADPVRSVKQSVRRRSAFLAIKVVMILALVMDGWIGSHSKPTRMT